MARTDLPARPTMALANIRWQRVALIAAGLTYLALLVGFPLANIFYQALAEGLAPYWSAVSAPEARHAMGLTLLITLVAVPVNTVFGLLLAWVLARHRFLFKPLILGVIDLPLAISPVVSGMMAIVLFSHTNGFFGPWLAEHNLKIIFALPSMILVTLFVTLPFVAREVLPVLQAVGEEQELAAQTLGASPFQVFWHVTLPEIRQALLYGVILTNARALGEFGAVSVVSGKLINETMTLTLHIEQVYIEYQTTAAFACASILALVAVFTLVVGERLKRHEIAE